MAGERSGRGSDDLPEEARIPARIVLSDVAYDALIEQLHQPPRPTRRLIELMQARRGP